MSVKGLLLRFFLLYMLLIVLVGLLMSLLGLQLSSVINTSILAGSAYWVCSAFGKKNGRKFSKTEKTVVVLTLIAIDVALQFCIGAVALSQSSTDFNAGTFAVVVSFVGFLHAVVIYISVSLANTGSGEKENQDTQS